MNFFFKTKKYFATRRINKQIKKQILLVKAQKMLANADIDGLPIRDQFVAMLICAYLPLKGVLKSMLENRRRIIKSLTK